MSIAKTNIDQDHEASNKLIYIDNIKVLLIILVVLHHTFIAYSSSEGWYYNEPTPIKGAKLVMTMPVHIRVSSDRAIKITFRNNENQNQARVTTVEVLNYR